MHENENSGLGLKLIHFLQKIWSSLTMGTTDGFVIILVFLPSVPLHRSFEKGRNLTSAETNYA